MVFVEFTKPLVNIFCGLSQSRGLMYFRGSEDHPYSRFEVLTWKPCSIISAKGERLRYERDGKIKEYKKNIFDVFEGIFEEEKSRFCMDDIDLPELPFISGGMGYFAYDLKHQLENISSYSEDDLGMPDIFFCFYDHVCVHDRKMDKTYVIACNEQVLETVRREIDSVKVLFNADVLWNGGSDDLQIHSSMTREQYGVAFKKVKNALRNGRIYQINLPQRLDVEFSGNARDLFLRLSKNHPAPYAAYMHCGDFEIVSISPERFVSVTDRIIETCPIKGTAKRGKTVEEDVAIKRELIDSVKENAELSMIVDLERNDIGKICEYGSVHVPIHRDAIPYNTLWQIVSTVRGELREGVGPVDVLRAMFPGGSVVGCPKIEAMKMSEELEPVKRGIYNGALGWIDYRGNMDMSIIIRTLLIQNNRAYFHVGGGIVMDSDEQREYDETWLKAEAMVKSL